MNFKNLTPHAVNVRRLDGTFLDIPASGNVARVEAKRTEMAPVDGIAVRMTTFGALTGLPAPQAGTIYIVSALVAQHKAAKRRVPVYDDGGMIVSYDTDVLVPGESIRDEAGRIVGCDGLAEI